MSESDHLGAATRWGRRAVTHQRSGDHRAALQAFEQSLASLRRCDALRDVGIVLNNMAVSYRELGQREQAIQCHERALEIRRDLGDRDGMATSLHNLGVLHADIGAHEAAKQAFDKARRLRQILRDEAGVAATELRIGMLHEQQGDFKRAAACYVNAITLCEGQPDDTDNLAAALCNLGGLLIGQAPPARVMSLLERARSLLGASADTPAVSYVEYNLGLARIAQGDIEEGLAALATAQRIQERCGDLRHLSATLSAQAVVLARRGELASAETLLQQALEVQGRLEEHPARIHTLRLLGDCKAQQGQSEAAKRYFAEAEQLSMLVRLRTPVADAGVDVDVDITDGQRHAAAAGSRRSLQ
ncbi:tetratricopeptide repeat protein [Aquincola sp. S2]|uniref:Tetratricopeptide repeat protein n=1 Tax=Pseudaquabacterium terrae TaxID=2732868 RepID=A0ABX2EU96_9BURK|nr:tetratricopeptide repeat protein [Aquabacterium terrae]NRF72173.1 tetratricopeptide repeat protein [Aquabacterium terrae]